MNHIMLMRNDTPTPVLYKPSSLSRATVPNQPNIMNMRIPAPRIIIQGPMLPSWRNCTKPSSSVNRPIEPMIGHAKCDGRLGRNHLLGQDGDKINALLAAAGHNLRLILRALAFVFAKIIAAFLRGLAKVNTSPTSPSRQTALA